MMKQCLEEDEFRKKEVDTAQDSLNKANDARKKCDDSLKSAQKDLPELKAALATYEAELLAATTQREKENTSYKQRKADFEEAIAFLKDFIDYVAKTLKGSFTAFSFVEHSEKLLRHATRLHRLSDAVPVLVALATVQAPEVPTTNNVYAYNANQNVADKLKDTLNKLLQRLQADWKDNEDVESKALSAFTELKTKLENTINTLKTNIDRTEKQILAMTKCTQEEDAIIANAGAKLNRNGNLKDSASKMCGQFAKEFVEATKSRTEEIETINQILAIIEKRFGKIPQDIKSYLDSVESGWKAYQNSTGFKGFVEYQQVALAAHTAGSALVAAKSLI